MGDTFEGRPRRPHGVRRLFRLPAARRRLGAEIDDELAFHLERRVEELIAEGMEPEAARREAERRFGDRVAVRRECRRIDGERETRRRAVERLGALAADTRMALHQLLRAPGFTLLAVFTLALGIGGASAIYSVVHAVLLRSLPVDEPGRVVLVWESRDGGGKGDASAGNFDEWRRHAGSFAALAASRGASVNLTAGDRPERVVGLRVNAAFFDVLGVEPRVGRVFRADEDRPGAPPVAVLSHGLWQRRFAADRGVVGRSVRVDGAPHTVVGVMPERFDRLGLGSDLWLPLAFSAEQLADHDEHSYLVFGRLAAGVSARTAAEELAAVTARMQAEDPDDQRNLAPLVVPFSDELVDSYRLRLWMLFAAVALVLAIACVNVSNLLLTRGTARRREMAVRTALGARRGRLVRGLLIESLLLALAGAAAGLALAGLGVRALVALAPAGVPRLDEAALDGPTFLFAVVAAVVSALAAGLLPALRGSRRRPQEALSRGGRSGGGRDRLRGVLVAAELALAFTLLVAATLLVRSAVEVNRVDPGFESSGVLTARLTLDEARYGEAREVEAAYERLVERAAVLPGVSLAAATNQVPFGGGSGSNGLLPEGREPVDENFILADLRVVTPDYLELLRVPTLAGRGLDAGDRHGAPPVMLVNETLARLAFPEGAAVGRRIACCVEPDRPDLWKTVVGVVGDVRGDGLDADPVPTFYLPLTQVPPEAWRWLQRTMVLAVRTEGDPGDQVEPLRQAVLAVDGELPVFDVATLDERLVASRAEARFTTLLLLALAAVGTLLAAVGLYGTVAYVVEQRRHEIGVRMALGATAARVVRSTAAAMLPAIVGGLGVGLVGALGAGKAVESLLFGVGGGDPLALGAAAALLATVALAACLLPARRAANVDPVRTLGAE